MYFLGLNLSSVINIDSESTNITMCIYQKITYFQIVPLIFAFLKLPNLKKGCFSQYFGTVI